MKRAKQAISLILVLAVVFLLAACGSTPAANEVPPANEGPNASAPAEPNAPAPAEPAVPDENEAPAEFDGWPEFLALAAASSGGDAFNAFSAMAQVLTDNTPMTVSAQVTAGSGQNVLLAKDGDIDFFFSVASNSYYAMNGLKDFEGNSYEDFCAVWLYGSGPIHIVCRKGSGIQSVSDMKGHTVVVGPAGSGTELTSQTILNYSGVTYDDIKVDYSGVSEGIDKIRNGLADAMIFGGAIPQASITEGFLADSLYLIGMEQDAIDGILADQPYMSACSFPAGSYDGHVTEELNTVTTLTGLWCNKSVDEDLVYNIIKVLYENIDTLAATMATFGNVDMTTATTTPVGEMHPGAVRYFKELGFIE